MITSTCRDERRRESQSSGLDKGRDSDSNGTMTRQLASERAASAFNDFYFPGLRVM